MFETTTRSQSPPERVDFARCQVPYYPIGNRPAGNCQGPELSGSHVVRFQGVKAQAVESPRRPVLNLPNPKTSNSTLSKPKPSTRAGTVSKRELSKIKLIEATDVTVQIIKARTAKTKASNPVSTGRSMMTRTVQGFEKQEV